MREQPGKPPCGNDWPSQAAGNRFDRMGNPADRLVAVKKLKDADLLKKLALGDSDGFVRQAAVQRLNDPDCLVRTQAASQIDDLALLTEVVCSDEAFEVRKRALANITDLSALQTLQEEVTDPYVLKKIQHQIHLIRQEA